MEPVTGHEGQIHAFLSATQVLLPAKQKRSSSCSFMHDVYVGHFAQMHSGLFLKSSVPFHRGTTVPSSA